MAKVKVVERETIYRVTVEARKSSDGTFKFNLQKLEPVTEGHPDVVEVEYYSDNTMFPQWGPGQGSTRQNLVEARRTLKKLLTRNR